MLGMTGPVVGQSGKKAIRDRQIHVGVPVFRNVVPSQAETEGKQARRVELGTGGSSVQAHSHLFRRPSPFPQIAALTGRYDIFPSCFTTFGAWDQVVKGQIGQRPRPIAVLAAVPVAQIDVLPRETRSEHAAAFGRAVVQANDPRDGEGLRNPLEEAFGFDDGRGAFGVKKDKTGLQGHDLDRLVPRIQHQDLAFEVRHRTPSSMECIGSGQTWL